MHDLAGIDQSLRRVFKKAVQKGRRRFGARSVREYVSTTKGQERRWRAF